jgi:dihydrodipicolinate synthase/N-acetylneuraminate lyase
MLNITNSIINNYYIKARSYHKHIIKLFNIMSIETNTQSIKTAMYILKKCNNTVRLPLIKLEPQNFIKLKKVFDKYY